MYVPLHHLRSYLGFNKLPKPVGPELFSNYDSEKPCIEGNRTTHQRAFPDVSVWIVLGITNIYSSTLINQGFFSLLFLASTLFRNQSRVTVWLQHPNSPFITVSCLNTRQHLGRDSRYMQQSIIYTFKAFLFYLLLPLTSALVNALICARLCIESWLPTSEYRGLS